jgi:hypothetical protein
MGCNDSRNKCPEEELVMMRVESVLRYHLRSAQALYTTFTVMARGDVLNAKAFDDAVSVLNLCVRSGYHPGVVEAFYNSLRDREGNVSAKSLKLLAVLLGGGEPRDKARILFQIYDSSYSLSLDKGAVQQLASDLVALSVDPLSLLGDAGDMNRMQEYFAGLRGVRKDFEEAIVNALMEDNQTISRELFEDTFRVGLLAKCLSSSTLRIAMYEMKKDKATKRARIPPGLSLTPPQGRSLRSDE